MEFPNGNHVPYTPDDRESELGRILNLIGMILIIGFFVRGFKNSPVAGLNTLVWGVLSIGILASFNMAGNAAYLFFGVAAVAFISFVATIRAGMR